MRSIHRNRTKTETYQVKNSKPPNWKITDLTTSSEQPFGKNDGAKSLQLCHGCHGFQGDTTFEVSGWLPSWHAPLCQEDRIPTKCAGHKHLVVTQDHTGRC